MMKTKRFYLSAAGVLVIGVIVGLVISSRLDLMTPLTAKWAARLNAPIEPVCKLMPPVNVPMLPLAT